MHHTLIGCTANQEGHVSGKVEERVSDIVERAFKQYEYEVNTASLADTTKWTYINMAHKFVRWMRGDFEPGIRGKGG